MTKTTTAQSPLQTQAEASVDAVAAEIQRTTRQELDALRELIGARLASLERTLARDGNDPAFAPILQKLCEAATEQADGASASARAQAEEAAARQLAAVREQAQSDLDAAREQAQIELNGARKQHEAAQAQSKLEFQKRLAQSEKSSADAARALAEAERVAASVRHAAEIGAANLHEAHARIQALEQELVELALARDVADAHLEGEVQARTTMAAELDAVREMALYAQSDADTSRLALRNATERIRVLEERHRKLDAEPRKSAGAAAAETAATLETVRAGLQTLTATTTGRGLLDALLEPLAQQFSMVAWCVVRTDDYVVWGSRGFDPPLQSRKPVSPVPADSPLSRALAEKKPATARPTDGQAPLGLSGRPVGYAIALPIVEQGQGWVMLYAENPPESTCGDPDAAAKIAEIFADHVRRRLRKKQAALSEEPSTHSPERKARRVKIKKSVNVTIDGAPSALVDLSTTGAQVLSPRAVRPDHSVQLMLPNDNGGLSCRARVVWVAIEHARDPKHSMYRAGIQFRDVDAPEFEAFFSKHGIVETAAIKH
jgi:PilZ domain